MICWLPSHLTNHSTVVLPTAGLILEHLSMSGALPAPSYHLHSPQGSQPTRLCPPTSSSTARGLERSADTGLISCLSGLEEFSFSTCYAFTCVHTAHVHTLYTHICRERDLRLRTYSNLKLSRFKT